MTTWTSGYVTQMDYTTGYYSELNPTYAQFVFLSAGLKFPVINRACELGFGQGVSLNIHAAGSNIEWWGTDFIPAHAAFAKDLADASGANLTIYDESFEEFCNREDLPTFDFISFHGVWSWISAENRQHIINFLDRKLAVGGVVYSGYNTLAGWASFLPLRGILKQAAGHGDSISGDRVSQAVKFCTELLKVDSHYLTINPTVRQFYDEIQSYDPRYLAHEFLNQNWDPMNFSEISEFMSEAKLEYACSADLINHLPYLNFNKEQSDLLNTIDSLSLRETVADLMLNRRFRKDYWVRGKIELTEEELASKWLAQEFVFVADSLQAVDLTVSGGLGQANLNEEIYGPLLELFENDRRCNVKRLGTQLSSRNISLEQIKQALSVLVSKGCVMPVQMTEVSAKVEACGASLNRKLSDVAVATSESKNSFRVCSPLTNGAINLSQQMLVFVAAWNVGHRTADAITKYAWQRMIAKRQTISVNGEELTEEQAQKVLTQAAEGFLQNSLPFMRLLKLVKN